jgi:hypothetical protein
MQSADEIMKMADDDLRRWSLSGPENSYVHVIGSVEMNMRCALRIAHAAGEMAVANRDLVETTKQVVEAHYRIIRETRNLVLATWGVVFITLVTQATLIISEFVRK